MAQKMSPISNERLMSLRELYETVKRDGSEQISVSNCTTQLLQCFSSEPKAVLLCCKVVHHLLAKKGFLPMAGDVLRKCFSYLPFFFQNSENSGAKIVTLQCLANILERCEQCFNTDQQFAKDFPFTMLFHLELLISNQSRQQNFQENREILELNLQTFKLISFHSKVSPNHDIKVVRQLIRRSFKLIQERRKNLSTMLALSRLADRLAEAFLLTDSDFVGRFWLELQIEHMYGVIFEHLLIEITREHVAMELLLTIVFTFLRRELDLDFKMTVIRNLLDRKKGLCRMLQDMYRLTKGNSLQLVRFKVVVAEILTHLVWRFEMGSSNAAFQELKLEIYRIVLDVDWTEVIESTFFVGYLAPNNISALNLWFIMLVRHFEIELTEDDHVDDCMRTTNHVLNLSTFLTVCHLKQYSLPTFVLKYVLEGVAKHHQHAIFMRHESTHHTHLRQLLPTNIPQHIFGLLPATIPRLRWLRHSVLPWKTNFILRQRVEALEALGSTHNLFHIDPLEHFPSETLVSILCSDCASDTAKTNASMILSRVELPEALLTKVIEEKLSKKHQRKWFTYLRAIYGSLSMLRDEACVNLVRIISTKLKTDPAQSTNGALLIDSLTRIFITKEQNMEAIETG